MSDLFIRAQFTEPTPDLVAAQSCRHGGVSPAPFETLNLSFFTEDKEENIVENRQRFFSALDIPNDRIVHARQTHGITVKAVEKPGFYQGVDAFVTRTRNLYLCMTFADCTPALIYAPDVGAIACIHAGWKGTVNNVVGLATKHLIQIYGANPESTLAWLGVCIGKDDFEVEADVADFFPADEKSAINPAKWTVDLVRANQRHLLKQGLLRKNIAIDGRSTFSCRENFFSHRAEGGRTGRSMAVIGMR